MGKTNGVLRYLKFRSCASETGNGKDLCLLVGSNVGWAQSLCGAALWGATTSGTCSLVPLCARDLGISWLLWGKGGQWKQMFAVTMPQSTSRNSKSDSPGLPRPSDVCLPQCKPPPDLPSCARRNCWLFSTCAFKGQNSVLPILLRGAAQTRIQWPGAHMCLLPGHDRSHSTQAGKSSVQLAELKQTSAVLCGCPLTLLKSVDKL